MTALSHERPRKFSFEFRRALSLLPNLFTLGNLFCGFLAMVMCLDHPGPDALRRAALTICIGAFFDLADGRVARLTRSESALGEQLDSLSDLVTFGLAPSFLLYQWCLSDLGAVGVMSAFAFVAAGALRLARFNAVAHQEADEGPGIYFLGLPIPLGASIMVAVVLASDPDPAPSLGGVPSALALTLGLGGLMVSTVRFRTFKEVRGRRLALHLAFGASVVLLVSTVSSVPAGFLFLFAGYVGLSLLEAASRSLRDAPSLS